MVLEEPDFDSDATSYVFIGTLCALSGGHLTGPSRRSPSYLTGHPANNPSVPATSVPAGLTLRSDLPRRLAMKLNSPRKLVKLGIATIAAFALAGGCGADGPGIDGQGADGPGAVDDDDDDDDTGSSSGSSSGSSEADCPTQATGTSATKITVDLTWDATIGVLGGAGELVIWIKSDLTFDGNEVTGVVAPCGSYVPPVQANALLGGAKVQPIIPDSLWDSGLIPTNPAHGTVSGSNIGATITMDPSGQALGVLMNDPLNDLWPATWQELNTVDVDQSGWPGTTAYPAVGEGFGPPPLDIFPNGPKASELHLATRTVFELQGKRDTCTSAKGDVIVHHFDSHVVGCVVEGGGPCSVGQVNFIDHNRNDYIIGEARYEMTQVSDGASCAEVRATLPM